MLIDAIRLERILADELGVRLFVVVTEQALDHRRLTVEEATRFNELKTTPRRRSWLKGRDALKRLLVRMGEPDDTSTIRFPSNRVSLSHSASYAVAVGAGAGELSGIGVDLELDRIPDLRSARFFLSQAEQSWLEGLPEDSRPVQLLRLWTIKEAVFKADPENHARMPYEYKVMEPSARAGNAFHPAHGTRAIRYLSIEMERGFLTLAVLAGGSPPC